MTFAPHAPGRRRQRLLQEASLLEAPELLLRSVRGLSSSRTLTWLACVPLALFGLGVFNLSAHAAELPELSATFLANNLWVLIGAILVIFMNAGFAMVEAGLCQSKNAVNILAKNLIVFGVAVTAYWLVGYSLMYGNSIAGGWLFFNGLFFDPTVTADMVKESKLVPSLDFLFQAAFAGTSATIVSGMVAERIKFAPFVLFSAIKCGIIYPIGAAWLWNSAGWLKQLGFIDFAGTTAVHSMGAWGGLVGAIILGPRIGKFLEGRPQAIPGHNLSIATLGALLLWVCWYGFNGGSELAFNQNVPYICVTTTLSASAGGIVATIVSQLKSGKPDLSMTINGILAGLVSVTAVCNDISMPASWIVGAIGGALAVFSVGWIDILKIDDPVGAWSVHGTCGLWGTLAVGVFSTKHGLFTGHGFGQIGLQLVGAFAIAAEAIVTGIILWNILAVMFDGIRVHEEEEIKGLDISEHGMEAYPDFATTNY
ncbi:ammonium transporter [Synechococcus sp. 1G10]|uniref:ammonium transporter n=1 Tax=Synechococcus sp. 1G10 TaxID=2025605 RepID=UPI000B9920FB|nr:ammonium transporter [Synechococcus sp. 1G10]